MINLFRRVLIFPKGNNVDHFSMYLDVADSASLPYGWSRFAQFSLAVVNQIHPKLTVRKGNFFTGLAFSFMYLLVCVLLLMYCVRMIKNSLIHFAFLTNINYRIKILAAKTQCVHMCVVCQYLSGKYVGITVLFFSRLITSEIYSSCIEYCNHVALIELPFSWLLVVSHGNNWIVHSSHFLIAWQKHSISSMYVRVTGASLRLCL